MRSLMSVDNDKQLLEGEPDKPFDHLTRLDCLPRPQRRPWERRAGKRMD